jgi:hypothetical protein
MPMLVHGWRCAVCGAARPVADTFPWRCPRWTPHDVHHVLHIVSDPLERGGATSTGGDERDESPFLTHDRRLAWAAHAAAHGIDVDGRAGMVDELDAAIAAVAGTGFRPTPFARSAELSDALGFGDTGGVWVKDETGNVAGSHKARHLVTILLHLLAAERLGLIDDRPPLAISSCGNAALAAADRRLRADLDERPVRPTARRARRADPPVRAAFR